MTFISREDLASYTEKPPFFQLLKALFEAKGYANVRITHGPDERGRDLVMDLIGGETVKHVAVVVKSKKVSGNTNGAGSAAEIYYQVRQCLGEPTINAESLIEQAVDEVIVITNKTFTEPALKSLKSTCGVECSGKVRFWNGDRLWGEVARYLGPQSLLDEIKTIVNRVEQFDEHYVLAPYGYRKPGCGSIGEIRSDDIVLEISERYPGSSRIQPYVINLQSRGKAAEALHKALTGEGGVVKGGPDEMQVSYPPILAAIMDGTSLAELRIKPLSERPAKVAVAVSTISLTAIDAAGDQTEIGPIHLKFASTDESGTTFSNCAQATALRVVVRSLGQENAGQVGFGLEVPADGTSARALIQTVRFLDRLHKAVALVISNHALPQPGVQKLPLGTYSRPPEDLLCLTEDLELVQAVLQNDLWVPKVWTQEQRAELDTIAALMRGFSTNEFALGLNQEALTALAEHEAATPLHLTSNVRPNCLGNAVSLKLHLIGASVTIKLENPKEAASAPVSFLAAPGSTLQVFAEVAISCSDEADLGKAGEAEAGRTRDVKDAHTRPGEDNTND